MLVNEFAPRVHNSGHWTLDGCEVDQFEQHVRAIAGWPLGPVTALAQVEMENLMGEEVAGWPATVAGAGDAALALRQGARRGPGARSGHVNRLRPL